MDPIRFDGRVAVITGAGRGLGRAHALELARRGARVVVNDLGTSVDGSGASMDCAGEVVAEIEAFGGEAIAESSSVAAEAGGAAIVAAALDAFGRIDVLINNAGSVRDSSFAKLTAGDVAHVLDVHLVGAFHVTRPAFAAMKEAGYGRILFTSSMAGLFGGFGQASYAAAKMGVVGLSSVLAIEGAKHGITSNVIAPLAASRMSAPGLGELADRFDPALVSGLAAYLVWEGCPLTHEVLSAGGGRYARAFVGLTPGWTAPSGLVPAAEDLADHLEEIRAEAGYIVPTSVAEESAIFRDVATRRVG